MNALKWRAAERALGDRDPAETNLFQIPSPAS